MNSRLNLGRPEDFSKSAMWRLYGNRCPDRFRSRRNLRRQSLGERLASYMSAIFYKAW